MKSKCAIALALASYAFALQHWESAQAGYRYAFPRDHFNHAEYQTEWWYYTGNLRAPNGHRFGFELTFFRQAVPLSAEDHLASDDVWRPDPMYLAHLALSDLDAGKFYHAERLNRAGPGLAGISLDQRRYWNGNWQVRWLSLQTQEQELQAVCDQFTLTLRLDPQKPLIIHGQNGVSRKGAAPGEASHYISFTRLAATGRLTLDENTFLLNGLAWMDHEFFTEPKDNTLAGWDWFAIQLENNEEIMLYRLRRSSGDVDPYSSGTFVDSNNCAHFLRSAQFSVTPQEIWQSPASGARYPITWKISIPSLDLQLTETTPLKSQELSSRANVAPSYWEGAVTYSGQIHARPITGVGYLEMTGYAKFSVPLLYSPGSP
ncbi:MAG: hypothetical protein JO211_02525 [Acidobacteriaceae bacterium]|nr:hypothetical protein [Acidobacteriaceae bacterium]